ncbi:hypothetical protein ACFV9C_42260 [Kribbella sp. NPDC059898]|uniref:hypothetical protein n=1 Tax=Kribbella sp. NPDC059898 TaxID=3346995 RepID=UPI003656DAF8
MKRFFSTRPGHPTRWRSPYGKLHLYLTAPAAVREQAARYQEAMADHEQLVSRQPLQYLHWTVQMIEHHVDELPVGLPDTLTETLKRQLTDRPLPRLQLTTGPAVVGVHGVTLWTPPPATVFLDLVHRCRNAVETVLGGSALAPLSPHFAPHMGLGYGLVDGDSDPLIRSIKDTWIEPVTSIITAVDLVAVDQHPEQGTFSWQPISTIDLT